MQNNNHVRRAPIDPPGVHANALLNRSTRAAPSQDDAQVPQVASEIASNLVSQTGTNVLAHAGRFPFNSPVGHQVARRHIESAPPLFDFSVFFSSPQSSPIRWGSSFVSTSVALPYSTVKEGESTIAISSKLPSLETPAVGDILGRTLTRGGRYVTAIVENVSPNGEIHYVGEHNDTFTIGRLYLTTSSKVAPKTLEEYRQRMNEGDNFHPQSFEPFDSESYHDFLSETAATFVPPTAPNTRPRMVRIVNEGESTTDALPIAHWGFAQPPIGQNLGCTLTAGNEPITAIVESIGDQGRIYYEGEDELFQGIGISQVAHFGTFAPKTLKEYNRRLNEGDDFQ